MSNKFVEVLETIGKGIAYPFVHTAQFVELIADVLKDAPEVKSDLTQLVELGEIVIADVGADIATTGLNFADDTKTLADVQVFFAYFQSTFLPNVEAAYKALKGDTGTTTTTTTTTTSTKA
jgi:hypothetical protein